MSAPLRLPAPGLRLKIAMAMAMISLLLIAANILSIRSITHFQTELAQVLAVEDTRNHETSELALLALQCRRFEKDLLLNIGDPAAIADYWAKWQGAYGELGVTIENLAQSANDAEERAETAAWRVAAQQYAQGITLIHDQIRAGALTTPQAANTALLPFKEPIRLLTEGAQEATAREAAEFDTAFVALEERLRALTVLILGLGLGGIVVAIGGVILLPRWVAAPIQELQLAAEQIAANNLSARVRQRGDDELGQLSASFNRMAETIQIQVEQIDQSALVQQQNDQLHALLDLVQQLETPVISLHRHVLLVPLVGHIDTRRAQQITQATLQAVHERQTQVVLIDITGISTVDTAIARHLGQLASAVKLLGARVILTGIRAEIAQAMIAMGINLNTFETRQQLQDGLDLVLTREIYRNN